MQKNLIAKKKAFFISGPSVVSHPVHPAEAPVESDHCDKPVNLVSYCCLSFSQGCARFAQIVLSARYCGVCPQ